MMGLPLAGVKGTKMILKPDDEPVRQLIAKQKAHEALDALIAELEKGLRPLEPPIKRRRV
jgi:hypothetical protein